MKKEFTPGHFFMNRSLIWAGREGPKSRQGRGGRTGPRQGTGRVSGKEDVLHRDSPKQNTPPTP